MINDGGKLAMSDLLPGTRIYYGGDMANDPAFGIVTRAWADRFGEHIDVTYDSGRCTRLSPCQFSREYLGHGGTRFVTEAEYKRWNEAQMAKLAESIAVMKAELEPLDWAK